MSNNSNEDINKSKNNLSSYLSNMINPPKIFPDDSPNSVLKPIAGLKEIISGFNLHNYILIFISIATVVVVALSLTVQYGKNNSSNIILSLAFFVFSISIIGYLYYLNYVIGNTTALNMEKIIALRNKNIVYLILFLGGIFLFYVGGFQSLMRKHQTETMITSSIISFLYLMYKRRYDYNNIKTEFFKTLGMLSIIALFVYNPFNITPKLTGLNVSFIMMAIIFFIVMITYYNNIYTDKDMFKFAGLEDGLKKMFLIIFSIIMSIGVIVLILSSFNAFNKHDATPGSYFLNVAIIIGMLGLIYKTLDSTGILTKHPLFKLIVSSLLYVPCLLTNILELILKEYYQTTNFTVVLLVIEIMLIIISLYYPKIVAFLYTSDDGKRLVNEPIDISSEKTVGYYESLTGNGIIDLIKNPDVTDVKVGNEVQVKQDPKTLNGKIIKIHKNNHHDLYDIHYEIDGTYQYNVNKKDIKTEGEIMLDEIVSVTRKWIAGTISKINFNGTYSIEYKSSFSDLEKELLTKTQEIKFSIDNVNPNDITIVNQINPDKNTYKFAISFWVFINSMPPNTNKNYSKYTSLLNYSNNPNVMYNPSTHDFIVSVNQNIESPQPSTNINDDKNYDVYNIIYSNKNMPLQKWNNIVINYDSGTIDIFLNGELVQSSNKIVPNIKYNKLTVGANNGIKAGLCNLVYFKEPLNIITINNLYNITKIKETPSVPEQSLFSLNL
jgi:hypothetical protein